MGGISTPTPSNTAQTLEAPVPEKTEEEKTVTYPAWDSDNYWNDEEKRRILLAAKSFFIGEIDTIKHEDDRKLKVIRQHFSHGEPGCVVLDTESLQMLDSEKKRCFIEKSITNEQAEALIAMAHTELPDTKIDTVPVKVVAEREEGSTEFKAVSGAEQVRMGVTGITAYELNAIIQMHYIQIVIERQRRGEDISNMPNPKTAKIEELSKIVADNEIERKKALETACELQGQQQVPSPVSQTTPLVQVNPRPGAVETDRQRMIKNGELPKTGLDVPLIPSISGAAQIEREPVGVGR